MVYIFKSLFLVEKKCQQNKVSHAMFCKELYVYIRINCVSCCCWLIRSRF